MPDQHRHAQRAWQAPAGTLIPVPRSPVELAPARQGPSRPAGGRRRTGSLNERDVELVRHLSQGRSTAQISAAMQITGNTTRTRIRRVEAKLAVTGRSEAVLEARVRGLV